MRGLVVIVSVVVVLGVLAGAHAERRAVPPPTTGPVPASLPPGLWFRSGHYETWLGEAAPSAPTHAVIAGVFGGAAQAERASRAVDRAHVDLGFPWAVANHSAGRSARRAGPEAQRAPRPRSARAGAMSRRNCWTDSRSASRGAAARRS